MRRLAVASVLALAAACTGSDPVLLSTPSSPNDGGPATAENDASVEDANARVRSFGRPTDAPFVNVNTPDSVEEGASLTLDERTVYFSTNRGSGSGLVRFDLWFATRASVDVPFEDAKPVAGIPGDTTADRWPVVSPDGKELYFSRLGKNGSYELMHAALSPAGPATTPVPVASANGYGGDKVPGDAVGTSLWFWNTSGNPSGVAIATILGDGGLGQANHDLDLSASVFPAPSSDGTTLFYALATAAHGLDVYSVTRNAEGRYRREDAVLLTALNTDDNEVPRAISADGRRLYLASSTGGATSTTEPPGSGDLLMAERLE